MERLIVPEIVKLSKDATWRVRLATIQFCPLLPKFISAGAFTEHIEPLLKQWMEDTVHSVRVEAVSCTIILKKQSFNLNWLENLVDSKLDELHQHPKFGQRIHTLFAINLLHSEVSDSFLNEKMYKKYMKKLSEDPVPNIRFNYAKTTALIYHKLTNSNKMGAAEALRKLSENDPDVDVKFYAQKAIRDTSAH